MFTLPITDRLALHQRQLSDAEEMFALTEANRAHLRRWLPWLDHCTSVADTRRSIESTLRQAEERTGLAASIREDGRIVGVISFNSYDLASRIGHLGYWLDAAHQGRGLMTAACRTLIAYGFDTLSLNRLVIACAADNARSRAIPERLGFSLEGIAREAEWLYDHFVDHAVHALLRRDWEGQAAAHARGQR